MDDGITFEAIFIPIMIDRAVQRIGKNAEVAHTERLKQETERVQIVQQVIRSDAQSGSRDGRIDKIARVCGAYRRFGAKIGIPSRHILNHKDFS